jgi:dipeptidyl-peptidase-4
MLSTRPGSAATALLLLFPAWLAGSEELPERLRRIFDSPAFAQKRFGPARWVRGGAGYTTLETTAGANEIVEYNTVSGERKVVVSARQLTPPGGARALTVDDYEWSGDGQRLLIYTESRKVWRTNSRGDYWVLDRAAGKLQRCGR